MKLAYTLSAELNSQISVIENIRRQILLSPIPPKTELRLRWDAVISRIQNALLLSQKNLSKKEIVEIISTQSKKKEKEDVLLVSGYNKAFNQIRENWLLSPKNVHSSDVLEIVELSDIRFSKAIYNTLRQSLEALLEYLQSRTDHPLIQAALVQSQINQIGIFENKTGWIGRLLSYLFLYKSGFDFRGLLVLEEEWVNDRIFYLKYLENVARDINCNRWILYFMSTVSHNLGKVIDHIGKSSTVSDLSPSFFELNDRQKRILSVLDNPQEKMTNQKAQKFFKISQITASRDLSRLAVLGFIYSHGKGRSVYYTKI